MVHGQRLRPLASVAVVGVPTVPGGYLGSVLTRRLSKETLGSVLGWAVALTGVLMLVQGGWKATRPSDLQLLPRTPAESRQLDDETDEWLDEPDWFDGAAEAGAMDL